MCLCWFGLVLVFCQGKAKKTIDLVPKAFLEDRSLGWDSGLESFTGHIVTDTSLMGIIGILMPPAHYITSQLLRLLSKES